MSEETLLLGAVCYDPKVVTIWEGIRDHFIEEGVPLDFVLFSNYEQQVKSLLAGHIDIAWNTPLAHVRVKQQSGGQSRALGMRDSDRDFRSRILVRSDAGISSLSELEGQRLAVGTKDSTQANILPLYFLGQEGVDVSRIEVIHFDQDVGKHGDTGTSELSVLQALAEGKAVAGTVGELVWVAEQAAGHVDASKIRSLWTTPPFDHCMFDARVDLPVAQAEAFRKALFAMQWDNPKHRRLLELEGLREWMPPREEGYESLEAALAERG